MKETEAKEKWCPFSRINGWRNSPNRMPNGKAMVTAKCFGSDCACWVDTTPNFANADKEGHCGLINE